MIVLNHHSVLRYEQINHNSDANLLLIVKLWQIIRKYFLDIKISKKKYATNIHEHRTVPMFYKYYIFYTILLLHYLSMYIMNHSTPTVVFIKIM